MKQETLVFTALFLIFLVVNLPTATAANFVNVQAISGKDNVNSVRREEDQLKVEASVVVAEGSTENLQSNLFLRQQIGALQFETCTATGGNTFLCKVTVPKTGTDRKFGLLEYSIVLFPGQTGKEAAPQTKIAVDNEAPRVESVAVSNNKITGGDVELQYTVKDTACPTCQNACAGIKQVDVYHAEGKSKLQSFAVTENKCTLAETKNLNLNSLPNGRQHLCVVPMDKFDQVSGDYLGVNSTPAMGYNCIEIQKDNSKPEIVSVELHYPQSRELADYVSYQGMLLTIGIEVKTKVFQLKNNAVTADLTQLGLAPVNVPCQEEFTNQFFCEHTFKAKLSQDGSKQIKVTAEDEMGNKQEKTESMELKMDSDTPQVERLGTAFTYQDGNATKSVFGLQNNTLVAVMQEQGSGFDRNQVFFEIEGNRLQASCEGNTCRYAGYGMRTSANQLVLGVKGTDDVGHAFQHQATVPVDRERATLVNASLINLNFKPFLVEGDAILVQVGLRDSYGISEDSTADFSQFSNSYQEHPTCEKTSDGFACTWHVFSVLPTPIVTAKFNILDAAHNLLESVVQQFSILFVREDTVHAMPSAAVSVARDANANASDFWMLKPGEPMPNFVDADTLEVTNYRIWFPVQFSQRGGLPVKIADVSFNPSTCTGEDVGLLEDISFVNPDVTDFSKSFIKFTLAQGAIEQDTIKFSCEISTVSKQGGLIYPEENDQVNLTIPVLRAGEISEAVVEEIKDVRGSWLVEAEFIGTLNKWLRLGKNICNFLAALGGLLVKLDNSEIVMEPMEHHPLTKPFVNFYKVFVEGATGTGKGLFTMTAKICKWVSCRTGWQDHYNKWNTKMTNAFLPAGKEGTIGKGKAGAGSVDPKNLEIAAWPSDPSQSLILSIAAFCIPGIMFNLQKAREIECSYLECLVEEVPEGTPSFVCSRLRNYGWCRYVYGEIFQVLPFANFVHDFVGTISRVLSNPLSALLGISQWFCSGLIPEGAAKHGYCNVVKQIVQWGDTLQDIHTIFKTDWKLQKDACEDVLKSVDEKLDSNFQMPGAESSLIGEGFEEEETPSGGSSPTQPGGVGVSGG